MDWRKGKSLKIYRKPWCLACQISADSNWFSNQVWKFLLFCLKMLTSSLVGYESDSESMATASLTSKPSVSLSSNLWKVTIVSEKISNSTGHCHPLSMVLWCFSMLGWYPSGPGSRVPLFGAPRMTTERWCNADLVLLRLGLLGLCQLVKRPVIHRGK